MATTVYTTEEITLQDGVSATLKPLNIKGLRKFMARMDDFKTVETEEEGLEVLLDAAAICLMKENPQYWDKEGRDGKGKYTDEFEDAADMPTVYRILNVCGGVDLTSPELMAAATEALGQS